MISNRCGRCLRDQLYIDYHDQERGIPVHDDRMHFEFLLLESFQAGLSRYTILHKRENFRIAFDQFDPYRVSNYDQQKIKQLTQNKGIIRHRGKIIAAITNANIFMQIQSQYGSRDNFIRSYTDHNIIDNYVIDYTKSPSTSLLSDSISIHLKKLGMKFVGSTTMYSYLQAVGMINDHEITCCKH